MWQGVELTRIHTGRNHEVTCTLGSRFDEHWGFHLQEVLGIKITTHLESQLVTKFQILAHHRTTQVEITILHTEIIAAIGLVFDGERWNLGSRNHVQLFGHNLDIASRNILILAFTFTYNANHLNDIFTTQVRGLFTKSRISLALIENELSDTITITKINESEAAHLADALHPSGQRDLLANIGKTKLATGLFTIHSYVRL